jgi:hypothetical protein
MQQLKTFSRFILSTSIILLMLCSCGGSDNSDESSDPIPDNQTDGNSTEPQNQDPSILKVSDLRTAANPYAPHTVFNSAGDGLSVWAVTSEGT